MKKKAQFAFPSEIYAEDIRAARKALHMSQTGFADFLGVSVKTVSKWEQGNNPVRDPVVPLLSILFADRQIPGKYEIPEQKYPVRLFYMYMNQCCTIIDVNESERIVKIINFTPYPMYRAFGTIDSPTFEEYETFLESRCFPRERETG